MTSIAFLGAGKLSEAIIRGVIAAGAVEPGAIVATCRRAERADELRALGVRVAQSATDVAAAETAVLGVRHADLPGLLDGVHGVLAGKTVISLVIGVRAALIERATPGARVVRAVPNTPVSIRRGVTVVAAGATASRDDVQRALALFGAVGDAVELPEDALDAANALSGAGPAYLYALQSALVAAGVRAGLDAALANRLVSGTLAGAAQMLAGRSASDLIAEVASPGGSTRAALDVLERRDFAAIIAQAVQAAMARAAARNGEAEKLFGTA